jgi:hypothetical protein
MPIWLAIHGYSALALRLPWRPDHIIWVAYSKCCAGEEGSETTQRVATVAIARGNRYFPMLAAKRHFS